MRERLVFFAWTLALIYGVVIWLASVAFTVFLAIWAFIVHDYWLLIWVVGLIAVTEVIRQATGWISEKQEDCRYE